MRRSVVPCELRITSGSDLGTCWSRTRSARKKRRIRRIVRRLPIETALLVEDETDLLLFPPLRAGWAKAGEAVQVCISGGNARRVLFGAMELRTGQRTLRIREHGRSEDFQVILRAVRRHYADQPIALLLDEDSSHTAQGSVALAKDLQIQLLWLPKRAPELNPMDTLWRHAKDPIIANGQYQTIEEQARRFVVYLQSLKDHEALKMAGVLSHNFWLRSAL